MPCIRSLSCIVGNGQVLLSTCVVYLEQASFNYAAPQLVELHLNECDGRHAPCVFRVLTILEVEDVEFTSASMCNLRWEVTRAHSLSACRLQDLVCFRHTGFIANWNIRCSLQHVWNCSLQSGSIHSAILYTIFERSYTAQSTSHSTFLVTFAIKSSSSAELYQAMSELKAFWQFHKRQTPVIRMPDDAST